LLDQLDSDPNSAVVQTVLVVEGRLQVVVQRLGLVVDLVALVVMDYLAARQNFDLDLGLADQRLVLMFLLVLLTLEDQPLVLVVAGQD
jgi:hypothetical protein